MDGISSTATVIGLVHTATQVIVALNQYVSSVRAAESSRTKLLEQIEFICAAEKTMERVMQNSSRSSREPELQALIDKWSQVDAPPFKCKVELEKLSRWLERQIEDRKRSRWAKMVAWPMKEDKIQLAIRAFEAYMPYFHYILSIESLNLLQDMVTRNWRDDVDGAKHKILAWLDGPDCRDKHENTREQRQKTTGQWLLKEHLYKQWREGAVNFLWLHGRAGAGKSVLASLVIDDLLNGLFGNETLAYFYFDFRSPRCMAVAEALRSLIRQLLFKSKKDWLSSFSDLVTRKEQGSGPPTSLGILTEFLIRAAKLHERPIIVIDALDECEDLSKLLCELKKLLSSSHCLLFVTSRTLRNIEEAFVALPSLALDDRIEEVRDDMYYHIKTELRTRTKLRNLRKDLREEIEDEMMRKADGMFRWVQCQLDRLNDCCALGDVREVLDTLPTTLYETYGQMLQAIDRKPFGSNLARRALTWLVTALEPLKLVQLAEAISTDSDKLEYDPTVAPMHENVILDVLGSLVVVDYLGYITLSHYSVKEYLTSITTVDNTYFIHQPTASVELATISIFSLRLDEEAATAIVYGKSPLYMYADFCGLRHLQYCHQDHNYDLVKHLLDLQDYVSENRDTYERVPWFNNWIVATRQLALYIIIRFGHPAILRFFLDHCPVRATENDNPLVFAALNSDAPRVQMLLDHGLDFNLEGIVSTNDRIYKMTPLAAAARNVNYEYQEKLVRLLLDAGCVVFKDALYTVLVCVPGVPCTPSVVRILLERGADPLWLGHQRRTTLHAALASPQVPSSDHLLEISCMLVVAGCDPMVPDAKGVSPLDFAIRRLFVEFIQWLVQSGFQLPTGVIPRAFSDNLAWFHSDINKLSHTLDILVKNGADASEKDALGNNALHLFSSRVSLFDDGSIEFILGLLVSYGCPIDCENDAEETPLKLAVSSADPMHRIILLDLFLSHGAKLPMDIAKYINHNFNLRAYATRLLPTELMTLSAENICYQN